MTYRIRLTRQAVKDVKKLSPKLQTKVKGILRNRLAVDPYSGYIVKYGDSFLH